MAYYRYALRSRSFPEGAAYVLPDSLPVMDTPAEVRVEVTELKKGDRLDVLGRRRNWTHVRMADGRTGWVEGKTLLDSQSFESGQQLMKGIEGLPAQAVGHPTTEATLHLEASRDSPQLALLDSKQRLEVFGRRLVERPPPPDEPAAHGPKDAWYLVRAGSQAGWVLGRLVTLNVPAAISGYAQDVNLVGWLTLNTVDDEGRQVPQYLVADRIGTQEVDFNHVRVFTWWKQKQSYATAYAESNLNGFFPIQIARLDGVPYFRLRLRDEQGRKYQKVYGLFNTATRPIGTVEGWTADAMPAYPMSKRGRRRE